MPGRGVVQRKKMEEEVAGGSMPFLSLDAALRYLRYEIDYEGWEEDTPLWTLLRRVFDPHTPLADAHFEVVGGELYIFLNGKQFVRVATA